MSLPLIFMYSVYFVLLMSAPVYADACLDCHLKQSPQQVAHYQQSAHADKVDCADCHGADHDRMISGESSVTAETCGTCHPQALAEHRKSQHGQGLHSGWGCTRNLPNRDTRGCNFCHAEGSTIPVSKVQCARFLAQTAEMQQLGCNRCHQIENNCASCHSNHQTAADLVKTPAVCSKCHMGPDHPQWEMWQTSQHGQLFAAAGLTSGPSCQTCHMAAGSHDVSIGITSSPAGKRLDDERFSVNRASMLQICLDCHARSFVEQELLRGDRIKAQSQDLVNQARGIIVDLADRGLLQPMPSQRPAHPLRNQSLVLDGQMLYENISHIERLFFKMMKYSFAKTWKGAYHQNPAYAHWYGNAELKMDLADIQAEALRLKQATLASAAPSIDGDPVEAELKRLRKLFGRGALSDEEYKRKKSQLLQLQ